jgi:hypothetical protein
MQSTLFRETLEGMVAGRDDPRIRTRLPVNAGRPGYDALLAIYRIVMTCTVRPVAEVPGRANDNVTDRDTLIVTAVTAKAQSSEPDNQKATIPAGKDGKMEADVDRATFPPMTSLHEAAARGRIDELSSLLSELVTSSSPSGETDAASVAALRGAVNAVAGPLLQTPLHFAAAGAAELAAGPASDVLVESPPDGPSTAADAPSVVRIPAGERSDATTPTITSESPVADAAAAAAECVYQLLVTGGADPTLADARNRVPYYLAANEKVRVAFRRARFELGESYCDWDGAAKVGPAFSSEDASLKRDRELEKRRQKKQRQKDRKAKDRAAADAAAQERQKQEEDARRMEEAKRIRDGLQPKAGIAGGGRAATNVCDYCQKVCVGKRRRDMYQRLEYAYCSTDCVQKHKRELMASAALARFSSNGSSSR